MSLPTKKFCLVSVSEEHNAIRVLGMDNSLDKLSELHESNYRDSPFPVVVVTMGEYFPVSDFHAYCSAGYKDSKRFATDFQKRLISLKEEADAVNVNDIGKLMKNYDHEKVVAELKKDLERIRSCEGESTSPSTSGEVNSYVISILEAKHTDDSGEVKKECAVKVMFGSDNMTELKDKAEGYCKGSDHHYLADVVTVREGDLVRCVDVSDTIIKSDCPKVYSEEKVNKIMQHLINPSVPEKSSPLPGANPF